MINFFRKVILFNSMNLDTKTVPNVAIIYTEPWAQAKSAEKRCIGFNNAAMLLCTPKGFCFAVALRV